MKTQLPPFPPVSVPDRARRMAELNPGYRWGYDDDKGTVGYYDEATDRWLVYCCLCLDGMWREYHGVRVNGAEIGREFVLVS